MFSVLLPAIISRFRNSSRQGPRRKSIAIEDKQQRVIGVGSELK